MHAVLWMCNMLQALRRTETTGQAGRIPQGPKTHAIWQHGANECAAARQDGVGMCSMHNTLHLQFLIERKLHLIWMSPQCKSTVWGNTGRPRKGPDPYCVS